MEQVGALLARYICTTRRIRVTGERDGVIPMASVPAILLPRPVEKACPDPEQAASRSGRCRGGGCQLTSALKTAATLSSALVAVFACRLVLSRL